MKRMLVVGALLMLVSTVSMAAIEKHGFYLGAGVSDAQLKVDPQDFSDAPSNLGEFKDSSTGWKAFGGYRIIKFFGVEASYNDWGTLKDENNGVETKFDFTAWNAQAVGYIPLSIFDIFGKVGYAYWDAKGTVENLG